jgi:hypothetical protein
MERRRLRMLDGEFGRSAEDVDPQVLDVADAVGLESDRRLQHLLFAQQPQGID